MSQPNADIQITVTEHNIQDTDLDLTDIDELIRLVKQESKNHAGDRSTLLYYGGLIGKLVCIRHELIK